MGIKHFWIWFKQNHGNSILSLNKKTASISTSVDTLAIDMNGIFHEAAQKVYRYGKCAPYRKRLLPRNERNLQKKFFIEVGKRVEFYRKMVSPEKKLILCVDGVAGSAKMSQQRQRRFRVANTKGMPFNPNSLTPGTQIMDRLTFYLDWYIKTQVSFNPDWSNLQIIFSNEKVPGEGEHKIVNYMRTLSVPGEKVCIHGMDADLIMLGLASPVKNVYILRDDSFNEDLIHFVDIDAVREGILNRVSPGGKKMRTVTDFVLMCYCVGNDFLPQIPGVEILEGGIDSLLSSYEDLYDEFGPLSRSYRTHQHLCLTSFGVFLETMAELEKPMIDLKLSKRKSFFEDKILESAIIEDTRGNRSIDIDRYKEEYYKQKFKGENIEKVCHEYIKGMQWVLFYYTSGIPSWSWFYPWDYAPFISDVAIHAKTYKSKKFPPDTPLSAFEQLITVLPPESASLIPNALSPILSYDHPILGEFFPRELVIDLGGKRREWEGIVLLPKIDSKLFKKEYEKLRSEVPESEARRNRRGKNFLYRYYDESRYQKSYWGEAHFNCNRSFLTF